MTTLSSRLTSVGLMGLALAAFAQSSLAQSNLMIWDGNTAAKGKGWVSPEGGSNKLAASDTAHKGKKSIEFAAAGKGWIGCGWNWFGWWPNTAKSDLSGYDSMRFNLKVTGSAKPNELRICLVTNAEGAPLSVEVPLSKHVVKKDAKFNDGEWHEIVIPMKAFAPNPKKPGFDLKAVWEFRLSMYSRDARNFSAYLDSVEFVSAAEGSTTDETGAESDAGDVVTIKVDAKAGRRPISPYLYGNNNQAPKRVDAKFAREVGLRFSRDSYGNNGTKYNWRDQVTTAPDWYNNVYKDDRLDRAVKLSKYAGLQALYSVPALGWVAKPEGMKYNYTKNDGAKKWPIEPSPKKNLCANGDTSKYLRRTTPKEVVDMLDYMFASKPKGMGLSRKAFKYIHIDNEPDCWATTHDDVPTMTAEECVQKYVAVAKELRRRYPKMRILAPGFTAEWFWWNWSDHKPVDGMPWMQYFVKRMAEESEKAGVRLIDVVDFHTYLNSEPDDAGLLQEHRIFYDPTYEFPRAKGLQTVKGEKVERVFDRMNGWLDEYFGKDNDIGLAVTECMVGQKHPPMLQALWYASMLGTFADHGVEIFAPWEWTEPLWEVMHLFSRHGQANRVEATSTDSDMVSAYASISDKNDKMTIIFVNREPTETRTAEVTVAGFAPASGKQQTLMLADLTKARTFHSHKKNALQRGTVEVNNGSLTLQLPPYSIVAVVLDRQ